jgi:hypothetical protein
VPVTTQTLSKSYRPFPGMTGTLFMYVYTTTGGGKHGNCQWDKEEFPNDIFELVPLDSRRKHCICNICLNKYKEEQKSR